jgi:hypothetical protein
MQKIPRHLVNVFDLLRRDRAVSGDFCHRGRWAKKRSALKYTLPRSSVRHAAVMRYGVRHITAQRAAARAVAKILCGSSPPSWGQCASTTLRVLRRPSRARAQRFTPAARPIPRPIYFTLSAPGFGAGGEPAHALSVLAARLARVQARCPIAGVTLFRHCDAMALIALSLARSLAKALISEELPAAQALSSPRRSAL